MYVYDMRAYKDPLLTETDMIVAQSPLRSTVVYMHVRIGTYVHQPTMVIENGKCLLKC